MPYDPEGVLAELARLAPLELALGAPRAALDAMERYVALEPQDAAAKRGLLRLRRRLASRPAEARLPQRVE